MKKCLTAALTLSALALSAAAPRASIAQATETADVTPSPLGTYATDFNAASDIERFDLYSSFGEGFKILNDCLWTNRSGEQKAVLKGVTLTDFTVQADFVTPVKNAYIDGGFYIGVRGDIADPVDCINAYQVCILRGGTHSVGTGDYPGCTVKIYKFAYQNGKSSYKFIKECAAIATSDLSVKVSVKDKNLSVYVCGNEDAALTYYMPDYDGGRIGFRTFYCQMGYDNLKIYSSSLSVDLSRLDALIKKAESASGNYTEYSSGVLSTALTQAKSAKESGNQYEIDAASEKLEKAINGLTEVHDGIELGALIEQAEKLEGAKYTLNSYASLCSVLDAAKTAAAGSADEQELSTLYDRLRKAIDDLTAVL